MAKSQKQKTAEAQNENDVNDVPKYLLKCKNFLLMSVL